MKTRRQTKANNRPSKPSEPPCPSASRSSSLRNEVLNSLINSSKLQHHIEHNSVESAPASSKYHVENNCANNSNQVAHLEISQPLNNDMMAYPPPSRPPSPTVLQHSTSNESTRSQFNSVHQYPRHQIFELAKLPTPRLALLTGSRKLISRLGQLPTINNPNLEMDTSPVCYLLTQSATLRELTINSAESMNGHILVCMHHKVSNIFKFIYYLRYIKKAHRYLIACY